MPTRTLIPVICSESFSDTVRSVTHCAVAGEAVLLDDTFPGKPPHPSTEVPHPKPPRWKRMEVI